MWGRNECRVRSRPRQGHAERQRGDRSRLYLGRDGVYYGLYVEVLDGVYAYWYCRLQVRKGIGHPGVAAPVGMS